MPADGVGIAAPVQHEVLVLHVVERLGIERHADEVKIGVEAVNLDRILDVVARRAVAVVVGIGARGRTSGTTPLAVGSGVEQERSVGMFAPPFVPPQRLRIGS